MESVETVEYVSTKSVGTESTETPEIADTAETDVERTTFEWTIVDFKSWFQKLSDSNKDQSTVRDDKHFLISNEFMRGQLVKMTSKWQMELCLENGNLAIGLRCVECFHKDVDIVWTRFDTDITDFNGSVLHSNGVKHFSHKNVLEFNPPGSKIAAINDSRRKMHCYWEADVISVKQLQENWEKLVPRNVLNLKLKLHIYREVPVNEALILLGSDELREIPEIKDGSIPQDVKQNNQFLLAVEQLWYTMEGFDLLIRVDGNELKAHKFVVAVQSPVIKELVTAAETSNSGEPCTVIDISGHSLLAVKHLLKYFYTQCADGLKGCKCLEFIFSVLRICNHLKVEALAKICRNRLLKNMTVENFGEAFLAIYNNALSEEELLELKLKAKFFLMTNQPALQVSEEFRKIAKAHPEQFLELCLEPPIKIKKGNRMESNTKTQYISLEI